MSPRDEEDLRTFEALRPQLIACAYRMLGDVARAQELVQEAWLKWHGRRDRVDSPRAFLLTVVTRLCLNELDSARARRETSAGLRLPEPVEFETAGMTGIDDVDRISMAFLVLLERLSPAERAVLVLHEVYDVPHEELAALLGRSVDSSRKLLERAREKVHSGRKRQAADKGEHERLLQAFVEATVKGDVAALTAVLAPDATLLTDAGPRGRVVGGIRNLTAPLVGARGISSFIVKTSAVVGASVERRELNGLPALVFVVDGVRFGALSVELADGRIQRLFFQGDPERLGFVGARGPTG